MKQRGWNLIAYLKLMSVCVWTFLRLGYCYSWAGKTLTLIWHFHVHVTRVFCSRLGLFHVSRSVTTCHLSEANIIFSRWWNKKINVVWPDLIYLFTFTICITGFVKALITDLFRLCAQLIIVPFIGLLGLICDLNLFFPWFIFYYCRIIKTEICITLSNTYHISRE